MTLQLDRVRELFASAYDEFGEDAARLMREFAATREDPQDVAIVEQVVADMSADHWRADPARMAVHFNALDGGFQLLPYIELLSRKFVDAVEGRSTRQIWNMPPQHGKTSLGSRWGPAWALDRYPWMKIILSSYGDQLASENSDSVREIIRTHSDSLRARLRPDRQERRRFITPEGGGIHAAGLGASITGFSAHGVVLDDPFKNWQDAHSALRRQTVYDQYRSTLRTRQTSDDFWVIIIMTRWHEDDLTARLLKAGLSGEGEVWELIRIAEVAEEPVPNSPDPVLRLVDPLGREPGELLGRFSPNAVKGRRLAAGPYLWSGMHQQRPSPEEGGELKRSWWKMAPFVPPHFDQLITSWDMKLKEKEAGDYVVGQVWGRSGSSFWMIDQLRGQWNQPTTENAIALLSMRYPEARRHLIENTGNGPEVMESLRASHRDYVVSEEMAGLLGMTDAETRAVQELRRRGLSGLIPVTVKGSKQARARAVSGYIEAGDVHLAPDSAGWIPGFLEETAAFPNGAYDDQVDAMSQGIARLARGGPAKGSGAIQRAVRANTGGVRSA